MIYSEFKIHSLNLPDEEQERQHQEAIFQLTERNTYRDSEAWIVRANTRGPDHDPTLTSEPIISIWVWSEQLQDAILIVRSRWSRFPRRLTSTLFPDLETLLIRQGFYLPSHSKG